MGKNIQDLKIAIIGAGTMGLGIATHFAIHGHPVKIYDAFPASLEKAKKQFPESLKSMEDLGTITPAITAKAKENLTFLSVMADAVIGADVIIENVPENKELKKSIFDQLNSFVGSDVILCSNTSSLNIFEFLEVNRPTNLVITHFFVPAYVMPLVEIVRGPKTSDETVLTVKNLMSSTGKNPAVVNQVIPGFIMNRLTFAIFREAAYMVSQGWCKPEDIDAAVISTHGPRYAFEGPFGLVDFAGVDTYEKISEYLLPELCSSPEVPKVLKDLFNEGKLGVKTESGFYTYKNGAEARAQRDQKIVKMIQAIEKVNKSFEA